MSTRLTIREYADREGISEVTVRRRIKRGELEAEKVETAQGFHYEIVVDENANDAVPPDQEADPDYAPLGQPSSHELITELRGQVDYLRQEIEDRKREHDRDRTDWRSELERLHTLMAQQGQTIQAITRQVEALPSRVQAEPTEPSRTILHTYLSQFAALVFVALSGPILIASFFVVEDTSTRWWILILLAVGVGALLAATLIRRRSNLTIDSAGQPRLTHTGIAFGGLYLLGLSSFLTSTVLMILS